ncbi:MULTISPECIES: helix-turn-helix domain-containing protein [unclassified Paenibacillus]|uniref:winged helix-turn-helix domain-containing protein n=1 Tax=unclassified Paenibacillus TaxID=185978 RepID=UPI00020D72C4|nr:MULTISPECIES: helix-turn-helix domain-containing protein [unclassified Paenibacillus]EGL16357.1 transcriptional regulatory protein, C-terminal domain protein [Paenibacillus sp. HGF7]EPD88897.1 hypothetical protein HMPREF1207_01848 [Paenibacillus sp. HGH0039]
MIQTSMMRREEPGDYLIIKLGEEVWFYESGYFIVRGAQRSFLTITEARLFHLFLQRPNERIFIEELIEHLERFSPCAFTEQNVYVHINRIRKKIEENPKQPRLLLNTRPGYLLSIEERGG